ncbi:protein phosphatase 1 regulatory subunit 35 isoform X1 [Synchiropus splendidus]|uniref:protein phosphatase 1 regulatory subunit 35 isoform X1 n=1 Tax=Synchiropus splendidus TaxID=270530 RepID=UPI00237D5CC0|nr:protein phosphatase 1 regulatory subunit 35 isoform X1 [Synchiropus splendidus]
MIRMAKSPSSFPFPTADSPPKPSPYPFLYNKYPELDLSGLVDCDPGNYPNRRGQARKQGTTTNASFNNTVVNVVTPENNSRPNNSTQLPTGSQLKTAVPVLSQEAESSVLHEHLFNLAGVELNSTLCLKAEIQALQVAEFQSQKAVEKTLKNSGRTKKLIDSRATEGVNITRSKILFNSLVSVQVPEDQLVSRTQQLTPSSLHQGEKEKVTPSDLFLKTSDLFRQLPIPQKELSLPEYLNCTPFPALSTFDLHVRQRRWES